MILSAMLAGCAGRDVRPERPPQPPQKPQSSAPTQEPAEPEAAPSSGGYYQDDGPHEQEPPNLSEVPDAEPKSESLHPYANRP
ncbi:MAG: septal ring lytic transglycosylase RlpA family protein, partial [Burkholderiales bacterium]